MQARLLTQEHQRIKCQQAGEDAQDADRPAGGEGDARRTHRVRQAAHRFDHQVGVETRKILPGAGVDHFVRTELFRQPGLVRVAGGDRDVAEAPRPRHGNDGQSDRPGAQNQQPGGRRHRSGIREAQPVNRHREGLRQGRVRRRERSRHTVQPVRRYDDRVRKASRAPQAVELKFAADRVTAIAARFAVAARGKRLDDDGFSRREAADTGAQVVDDPRHLVAHRRTRVDDRPQAVDHVQVRAAQATGGDP